MKALAWFLLVWLAGSAVAQEKYEIKLHRPVKVGDKFQMTGRIAYQSQLVMTSDGKAEAPKNHETAGKWSGELEVLGVTPRGLKDLQLSVREIELNEDGRPIDYLKAGDVLRFKKGEWSEYIAVNGQQTKDYRLKALAFSLCPVVGDGYASMDEAFGTAEKKAVGDAWDGHREAMIGQIEEILVGLKPEDVTGQVKLLEKSTVAGKPALRFAHEVNVDSSTAQYLSAPLGVRSKKHLVHLRYQVDLPLDPNSTAFHLTGSVQQETQMVTPFGPVEALESKTKSTLEVTVLPIP